MSSLLVATLPTFGDFLSPDGLSTVVRVALVLTVLSLVPSVLVMFTCFVRLLIVFHFLRQAMGTQTVPPNHVITGLALMLTFFVMAPVGHQAYEAGVQPYQAGELDGESAWNAGVAPVKEWMIANTRKADLGLFTRLSGTPPTTREAIPLTTLVPAFLISELKTAFQIGFLLFMPFLVIDLVVSSVLLSMGMMMLPPVIVSFPFKLLLFVMVDGWYLLANSLVTSFH